MAQHFPGCREIISEAFRRKGFPEESVDIALASLAASTLAQYAKPIKLWWSFCNDRGIDWFQPSIPLVLSFLSVQFQDVRTYGTLNSYRSALSLITNSNLGSDEKIRRFFKGVSVLKPSKPKYALTWDPTPVIEYLASLWPQEDLNLELLTRKLATLLILVSVQRVQTLSLIKRVNVQFLRDSVIIKIPDRVKTSGVNRFQPVMIFRHFEDQPALSIVSLLRLYMERTQNSLPNPPSALFLTFKKPIREASAQTISRWIKSTLFEGGIDTSVFSTHTTRHAGSSAAARGGISVEEIRKAAGWSQHSSTFANFYNRPLMPSAEVARAIILNR